MRNIGIGNLVNRSLLRALGTLLALMLLRGNLSEVAAQGSAAWAIAQAQQAVRQQLGKQEGGRAQTIRFNNNAQTEARPNAAIRVSGTGVFTGSYDARNHVGRWREFSYEAIVSKRGHNSNVSGVRYDWRGGWSSKDVANNSGRGDRGYGRSSRPNGRVSYTGPIMNRHSNKGLDVPQQSMQEGAHIQQRSFADQPTQHWNVIDLGDGEVAIVSRHSGMVLTIEGGKDNGAYLIQRNWNDVRQQRWRLEAVSDDYYRILSTDNGKCLDVTEQGQQNGASIQLWAYADQANQQWRLKR